MQAPEHLHPRRAARIQRSDNPRRSSPYRTATTPFRLTSRKLASASRTRAVPDWETALLLCSWSALLVKEKASYTGHRFTSSSPHPLAQYLLRRLLDQVQREQSEPYQNHVADPGIEPIQP